MTQMRILVGTDFSPAAARAVNYAAAWATREGAALRLVHVVPPKGWLSGIWRTDTAAVAAAHRHAGLGLKRLADTLDPSRRLDLSTGVVSGRASRRLATAAREFRADVLVIGSHGERAPLKTRHVSLGGSALKLLSSTPVPLFLVRSASKKAPASVTAAVDLSPISKSVITWACRCAARRAQINVVHVYEVPFAARLKDYGIRKDAIDLYSREEQLQRERALRSLIPAARSGTRIRRVVERGNAMDCLSDHIRSVEPDLIVLGHQPRSARREASEPYGSVARHVASFAQSDVLIVPVASS